EPLPQGAAPILPLFGEIVPGRHSSTHDRDTPPRAAPARRLPPAIRPRPPDFCTVAQVSFGNTWEWRGEAAPGHFAGERIACFGSDCARPRAAQQLPKCVMGAGLV